MKFLKRVIITALALALAGFVMKQMDGFTLENTGWLYYAVTAVILTLLNALLLPILRSLSCGMIVLSLGLFSLVLNAFVFWLAATISTYFLGTGFTITKPLPAIVGSLIVTVATMIFVHDGNKKNDSKE